MNNPAASQLTERTADAFLGPARRQIRLSRGHIYLSIYILLRRPTRVGITQISSSCCHGCIQTRTTRCHPLSENASSPVTKYTPNPHSNPKKHTKANKIEPNTLTLSEHKRNTKMVRLSTIFPTPYYSERYKYLHLQEHIWHMISRAHFQRVSTAVDHWMKTHNECGETMKYSLRLLIDPQERLAVRGGHFEVHLVGLRAATTRQVSRMCKRASGGHVEVHL